MIIYTITFWAGRPNLLSTLGLPHCPTNNLNLRTTTEPDHDRTDAMLHIHCTVTVWLLWTNIWPRNQTYVVYRYICFNQGWESTHLLRSLKSNERIWAIRSDCSGQMSDCERIAQVAHDKWVTVSDSLRSLMINKPISDSKIKFFVRFLYVIKTRAIRSFPLF